MNNSTTGLPFILSDGQIIQLSATALGPAAKADEQDDAAGGLPSTMVYVRSIDLEKRTADFIASTDAIDAYDEIVDQSNWILDRYKRNPIALWAHQSRELPIGVSTRCEVIANKLECTIRFLTADKNPKAEQVWRMVRDGELKAVSVGFQPRTMRFEMRNGVEVYVLADNELHEISVCNIPANPEALAKMKAIARQAPGPIQLDWSPSGVRRALNTDPPAARVAVAPSSVEGGQETDMNEKEFQTALATKDSEIADLKAKVATANAEKASAEDRAVKADERASALQIELTAEKGVVKALNETIDSATKLLGAKDGEALLGAAERAAHDRIAAEVEKQVGVKIGADERDDFIELAKTNRPLYERMIAGRKDLGIAGRVIPKGNEAPNAVRSVSGGDAGDELLDLLEKDASPRALPSADGSAAGADADVDLADLI